MLRRATFSRTSPAEPPAEAGGSLRDTAIRSGAYLAGREAVGIGIRLAGLVLVMRQIGPADFGIYSGAAAYVLFATTLAQMGAEVYLIRQPGPLARRRYDEVFTTLLLTSSVVVVVGMGLSFALAPWLRPYGVVVPLRVLLLSVPVNVLWAPMQACIERQFAYRRIGLLEIGGDIALYGTAVPLAFAGAGAWSLVAGFFAWQTWLLVGSMALSGVWPRIAWSTDTARALLAHGRTYALSTWIAGARSALLTFVVGTYAGAVGVGLVNFAQRLVSTMNFTDRAVHRIGMVAIAKAFKERPARLAAALEDGTLLLMMVSALPFAAFGLVARWVVPGVFGHDWLPALPVYVLLALWATLRVPVTVQRTLLYACGRNVPPAITSVIEFVIVCAVSALAVRQWGIVGFGIGSVVAVSSTAYTHVAANRLVAIRYRRLVLPLAALVPPVFVPLAPMPWALLLVLPPVGLLAVPSMRRELRSVLVTARATVARRRQAAPVPVPAQLVGAGAVPLGPVRVRGAVASLGAGGPEMTMHGSAHLNGAARRNGSSAPLFPPFQSWRLQAGAVADPTNPRIDRAITLDGGTPLAGPGARTDAGAGPLGAGGPFTLGPLAGAARTPAALPHDPRETGGHGAHPVGMAGPGGPGGDPGDGELLDAVLVPSDPVTGLPSVAVLLARLGRVLGATHGGGWSLAVVALRLDRPASGPVPVGPSEELLAAVAAELRGELRFDDLVTRVGPATFVVAAPFLGDDNGHEVAAHLEAAVRRASSAGTAPLVGAGWTVRSTREVVALPCDRDADVLVRRAVEALGG